MAVKAKESANGTARVTPDAVDAATEAKRKKGEALEKHLTISAPKMEQVAVLIRGTAPYVQNRWAHKAMQAMKAKQEAGSTAKKGGKREAKDFQDCYEQSKHQTPDGWCGIPASAFRCAMISACRLVNFKMTLAKLSLFVEADGFDRVDFTPLVKLTKGEPTYHESPVRNATGVMDLRARALFAPGWEAVVRLRYDAEMFSTIDILNLLRRVGEQVGIGEGRPDSPESAGLGWGLFSVVEVVNDTAGE